MITNLNTKYYYLINSELKMSRGKAAAQVSHVAMQLSEVYHCEIGRAIVLKATEKEMNIIRSALMQPVMFIKDAGFTEVPKGSLTCIGFIDNAQVQEFVKDLKLYT